MFRKSGLSVAHWKNGRLAEDIKNNLFLGKPLLQEWTDVQVFSDMEKVDQSGVIEAFKYFRELEAFFPEAVFILNTRSVEAWINSRVKHGDGAYLEYHRKHLGLCTKQDVCDFWRRDWFIHHYNVLSYFCGEKRKKLIIFDIDRPNFSELPSNVDPKFYGHHGKTAANDECDQVKASEEMQK
jgi:hypothetical protein